MTTGWSYLCWLLLTLFKQLEAPQPQLKKTCIFRYKGDDLWAWLFNKYDCKLPNSKSQSRCLSACLNTELMTHQSP